VGLATLAGVGAHAITTNIRKRRLIEKLKETSAKEEDNKSADEQKGGE
jgi:hypothetical protein